MGEVIAIDAKPERLLNSEEIAAHLRIDVVTVRRWSRRKTNPLPCIRYGMRGFVRYRMSEVESWLNRRKEA